MDVLSKRALEGSAVQEGGQMNDACVTHGVTKEQLKDFLMNMCHSCWDIPIPTYHSFKQI